MTRMKSNPFLAMGLCCLLGLVLGGCAPFDFFNHDFLNEFQPLGITSLNTLQGAGPINLVLENLSEEARHQETAVFTIYYIDAQGNQQTVTTKPLKAVPVDKRDPSKANFDPSYRTIVVLDCGVREIWFSGTVYRTRFVGQEETVDLGNQQSVDISYTTSYIVRTPSDLSVPATKMTTTDFEALSAVQMPPFHLQQTKHFKCGDIIVVGLLDQRTGNQTIDLVDFDDEITYTDLNSLSEQYYHIDPNDPNSPANSNVRYGRWIFDPAHSFFFEEYVYPKGYIIIPLTVPNMEGIDQAFDILVQMAAQFAGDLPSQVTPKRRIP